MLKNLINRILKSTVYASRSSSGEFLLKETNFGRVRVEFSVAQRLAERALKSVAGINESQVVVEKYSSANPMKILLTLTLIEMHSAPKVSEEADKAINNELQKVLGIDFYVPIEVRVKQIAQAVPAKRRVR